MLHCNPQASTQCSGAPDRISGSRGASTSCSASLAPNRRSPVNHVSRVTRFAPLGSVATTAAVAVQHTTQHLMASLSKWEYLHGWLLDPTGHLSCRDVDTGLQRIAQLVSGANPFAANMQGGRGDPSLGMGGGLSRLLGFIRALNLQYRTASGICRTNSCSSTPPRFTQHE
jgi:hypothetical protein